MLEKLDDVPWSKVKHAYGFANDVPQMIRDIANPDKKVRNRAYDGLYSNIFHQGTRYEATPFAIPFLFELLETETVPEKFRIIGLIHSIALGYAEEYLPDGFDVAKFRKEMEEAERMLTDEQRADYEQYGYSAQALIDCYDYTKAAFPILLKFLKSEDPKIRNWVVYFSAWFPELADVLIHEIKAHLFSISEEREIVNSVLSIGLLARKSDEKIDISILESYLKSDSEIIRIAAAIALIKDPVSNEILDILIGGLKSGENYNYVQGIFFNEGRLSGYISRVLSRFGEKQKEKVIPALCKTLESANSYQAMDITYAMLSILNKNRKVAIKDMVKDDLNSLELMVLNAILNHGGWTLGRGVFVNYANLLRSAGIPSSKEKLTEYLN